MIRRLIDFWLGRRAEPTPAALKSIEGFRPITVVTGGSRGIGFGLAGRFARSGCDVALVARHPQDLSVAAQVITREYGVKVLSIAIDVTEMDALGRIEREINASGFYLETLINCAGVGLAGPFVTHPPDELEKLIHLNVSALTRLTREALPAMLARGHGGIINVASLGGLIPGPNQAAYYASKAYVVSLSRALATEVAGRGVRVMALAPGPVDTGFHQAMGAELSFYRQLLLALGPRQVAFEAYLAYVLGFRLYVPGFTGKLLQIAVWIIPHSLILPLTGWLLRRRAVPRWAGPDDEHA